MDAVKVASGSLLVAVSCVVLARAGAVTGVPLSLAALGAIGLSAGTLLVDSVTS